MCEAHQHDSTPAQAPDAHAAHDHGTAEHAAHDHGSHDHGAAAPAAHDHGSHDHGSHDHGAHGHQHGAAATGDDLVECPVMKGSFVSKADAEAQGLVREYKGEQYYLCCAACGPLFDADPERYLVAA